MPASTRSYLSCKRARKDKQLCMWSFIWLGLCGSICLFGVGIWMVTKFFTQTGLMCNLDIAFWFESRRLKQKIQLLSKSTNTRKKKLRKMNCISHLYSPLYACTQAQMHTCVHACAHTQTPWDLSILLPSESHASFYCVFVPLVHLWSSAEKLFWILFAFLHFDHFFPFVIFLSFFLSKNCNFLNWNVPKITTILMWGILFTPKCMKSNLRLFSLCVSYLCLFFESCFWGSMLFLFPLIWYPPSPV